MELLEIIKSGKTIFVDDAIEDKKTKLLIKDINESLVKLVKEYESFLEFAKEQLEGDYHTKLVNLKSLQNHYGEWVGIKTAFTNALKEETQKINNLYTNKNSLVTKLKNLELDCQKSLPVVTTYHIRNGELIESGAEHDTIILGRHNNNVIDDIIEELENSILVEGNFGNIEFIQLKANYSVVDENIEMCNSRIDELFSNKPNKAEKISNIVNNMIEIAQNLVFFETYKSTLLEVGCPSKDVDLLEKDLVKKYVPFKKQLQKALKISLKDISSIVVDENEYSNEELDNEMAEFVENDIEKAQSKYFEESQVTQEDKPTLPSFATEHEEQEELNEVELVTEITKDENKNIDSPFDSLDFDLENTDEE